jgi:hypothetical protein
VMDERTIAPEVRRRVKTLQIVVGALATGVLAFAGVAWSLARPGDLGLLGAVGLFTVVPAVLLAAVAPAFVARAALRQAATSAGERPTSAALLQAFAARTISAAAILEGVAILNLVAYLLEGGAWNLAAAGVLVLGMFLVLPTVGAAVSWMAEQSRRWSDVSEMGRRRDSSSRRS